MVMGRIQEFLKISIRNRILVHKEGFELHPVLVKPARHAFPRILNIDADIVEPLDFNSFHFENVVSARNPDHALRSGLCGFTRLNLNKLLRQRPPLVRVTGQRRSSHCPHRCHQLLYLCVWGPMRCQDRIEAMRFDRKRQHSSIPIKLRLQFHSVVEVEVPKAGSGRDRYLRAIDVVFISIDNSPKRLVSKGPAARVDPVPAHRIERLPVLTNKEAGCSALQGCHTAGRLAIARRDAVPDPQMFSQLSHPSPLKKAYCRSSVLLRFQRSEMLTMWRGSSQRKRSTPGTKWNCPPY